MKVISRIEVHRCLSFCLRYSPTRPRKGSQSYYSTRKDQHPSCSTNQVSQKPTRADNSQLSSKEPTSPLRGVKSSCIKSGTYTSLVVHRELDQSIILHARMPRRLPSMSLSSSVYCSLHSPHTQTLFEKSRKRQPCHAGKRTQPPELPPRPSGGIFTRHSS